MPAFNSFADFLHLVFVLAGLSFVVLQAFGGKQKLFARWSLGLTFGGVAGVAFMARSVPGLDGSHPASSLFILMSVAGILLMQVMLLLDARWRLSKAFDSMREPK